MNLIVLKRFFLMQNKSDPSRNKMLKVRFSAQKAVKKLYE